MSLPQVVWMCALWYHHSIEEEACGRSWSFRSIGPAVGQSSWASYPSLPFGGMSFAAPRGVPGALCPPSDRGEPRNAICELTHARNLRPAKFSVLKQNVASLGHQTGDGRVSFTSCARRHSQQWHYSHFTDGAY